MMIFGRTVIYVKENENSTHDIILYEIVKVVEQFILSNIVDKKHIVLVNVVITVHCTEI